MLTCLSEHLYCVKGRELVIAFWRRLPIIVRAVLIGILVNLLALPWPILAGTNFSG
jgi:hypothetical protein